MSAEAKNKLVYLFDYAEPHPSLFKDSANRKQNKINLFIFYAEVQPIFYKDSAKVSAEAKNKLV